MAFKMVYKASSFLDGGSILCDPTGSVKRPRRAKVCDNFHLSREGWVGCGEVLLFFPFPTIRWILLFSL